jgi:hypothetical protein
MKNFEVWREGYRATGDYSEATLMGIANADTFSEACVKVLGTNLDFDESRMTLWGCRLFDNEMDARNSAVGALIMGIKAGGRELGDEMKCKIDHSGANMLDRKQASLQCTLNDWIDRELPNIELERHQPTETRPGTYIGLDNVTLRMSDAALAVLRMAIEAGGIKGWSDKP